MTPPTSQTIPRRQVVAQMSNTENADRFHSRKNPRLKNFDYSQPNYYFVTICTSEKKCIFGEADKPNEYGKIAQLGLRKIDAHFPMVSVDKYVVMPNHVHAILILREGVESLPTILGLYKSYVTKQIHRVDPERKVWQASFHDHVIRDQKRYERIWLYIDSNPANWDKDCFFAK